MTWGSSAGGQLAALAAVSCGVAALDPRRLGPAGRPPTPTSEEHRRARQRRSLQLRARLRRMVRGVRLRDPRERRRARFAALEPAVTLSRLRTGVLHGGKARFASPVAYVDENAPPILLIQGTDDHTVSPAQSPELYEALRAWSAKVQLMMLPGIDHSYIGATPEATREAALKGLAKTIELIDATIEQQGSFATPRRRWGRSRTPPPVDSFLLLVAHGSHRECS